MWCDMLVTKFCKGCIIGTSKATEVIGVFLQHFPSPTKVSNIIFPQMRYLALAGIPNQLPGTKFSLLNQTYHRSQIGYSRLLGPTNTFQFYLCSLFGSDFMSFLFKIAISWRWRCLFLNFLWNSSLYGNYPMSLKLLSHSLWDLLDLLQMK